MANELIYSDRFVKQVKNLPKPILPKLAQKLELLAADPFQPPLHSKRLTGKFSGYCSFRITRDYRVIFQFVSLNTIRLHKVAHRKDIYC